MGVIKGQNLRISIGGKFIAFATSCTLHVSAKLEDSSTKDSTGDWDEQEITGMGWDISTDALYSVDKDTNGVNGEDAIDMILAKPAVDITFEATGGEKNRVAVTGSNKYEGKAIVNDISVKAQNKQNTTYTLQATGTGELKKSDVAAG